MDLKLKNCYEELKTVYDEKRKIVNALHESGWVWDMETMTWACTYVAGASWLGATIYCIKKHGEDYI